MYTSLFKNKKSIIILICLLFFALIMLASCEHYHLRSGKEEITKAATCTEEGVLSIYCSCGEVYKTEPIKPIGHTMNASFFCDTCSESILEYSNNANDTCDITGCSVTLSGDIVLPSLSPNGKKVVSITAGVFTDSKITSVILPDGLKHIGAEAFAGCGKLESIIIPDSVTYIGDKAFDYCSSLKSIDIPNSVTHIGDYAFKNCASLKSITLPASWDQTNVFTRGNYILAKCYNLESLTLPYMQYDLEFYFGPKPEGYVIPDSLKNVVIQGGKKIIFRDCSSIESITLPEGITSIPWQAFKGCHALKELIIPNSVTRIDSSAFLDCTSLKSIYLPNTITEIQAGAFQGCISLESINIPESISSIEAHTFNNCSSLTNLTLPESIETIQTGAFSGSGIESIIIPEGITCIEHSTFKGCEKLKDITFPNSLVSIDDYAFKDCKSLESITLSDAITSIGDYAFMNCTSIKSIIIPASVVTKGIDILSGCSSLESMTINNLNERFYQYFGNDETTIPESLKSVTVLTGTSLPERAFEECISIESITLPDELLNTGNYAFKDCASLKNINLPEGLTEIEYRAFDGCISLQTMTLPNTLSIIYQGAFEGCSSLSAIEFPSSVKTISTGAFSGCSSLTSVYIPTSVNYIGKAAFEDCTSLESITLPLTAYYWDGFDYEAHFGYIFGYTTSKTRVEKYHIVSTNNSAGYAFYVTYNIPESLKSIVILDGITTINRNTFRSINGPTSIVIPKSVVCIESSSFYNFASLSNVYYTGSENEWNTIVGKENFESLTNATIHYNYVLAE